LGDWYWFLIMKRYFKYSRLLKTLVKNRVGPGSSKRGFTVGPQTRNRNRTLLYKARNLIFGTKNSKTRNQELRNQILKSGTKICYKFYIRKQGLLVEVFLTHEKWNQAWPESHWIFSCASSTTSEQVLQIEVTLFLVLNTCSTDV
jgi:hypothetical protein